MGNGWPKTVENVADKRPSVYASVRFILLQIGVRVRVFSKQQLQKDDPEGIDIRRKSADPRGKVLGSRPILSSPWNEEYEVHVQCRSVSRVPSGSRSHIEEEPSPIRIANPKSQSMYRPLESTITFLS